MGDAFGHAVLHYLERDPTVGFKQAWLWDDWPERIDLGLDRDQGVDIVAIDGEGRRVAVQVEFHSDPERNVTQTEVATLFSCRSDLFDRWWMRQAEQPSLCMRLRIRAISILFLGCRDRQWLGAATAKPAGGNAQTAARPPVRPSGR